jgi:hypothetical protein
VKGRSDFLRLTKYLKEMCTNRLYNYHQTIAQQNNSILLEYINQAYLGDIPKAVSRLALEAIASEKRHAQKALQ